MATDSPRPESDFQWIEIDYQNLDSLKALDFLKFPSGGSESSSTVYIGRHSEPSYINIGKIYTLEPYQGLTIPNSEGKVTVYKNFEILAMLNFDCSENEGGNRPEESNRYSLRMMEKLPTYRSARRQVTSSEETDY